MFSLLTLDLPSEVQTWHSWSQRHTGTTASSPTSQRDQNRRGYQIRHHTWLPPTHRLSKNIHTCRCHKAHTHTHTRTHTHVNHKAIVRVLTLWIWYVPSTVSPFPSFHPLYISPNSTQVSTDPQRKPEVTPGAHRGAFAGVTLLSRLFTPVHIHSLFSGI